MQANALLSPSEINSLARGPPISHGALNCGSLQMRNKLLQDHYYRLQCDAYAMD